MGDGKQGSHGLCLVKEVVEIYVNWIWGCGRLEDDDVSERKKSEMKPLCVVWDGREESS